MTVKELCNLIYKEDIPVFIKLGYDGDSTALDINNAFHMSAYGKFKVKCFRAIANDRYEIEIAFRHEPIIEE